ncbi:MAG: tRNA (guanine(10)-N(2))-dimethyltransferase [Archaeoglobaceae archaeon]
MRSQSFLIEGKAKLIVEGVFYNPRMKFCRDLDMCVFSAVDSKELLDALAASGVRGIRAALEAGKEVLFNDRDPKAVEVIRKNLEINGISAEVFCEEANLLMRRRHFEHIDLDPFGSPSHFVDSACFSARRYLSVTATDTAALCGSSTSSGLRKYAAFAVKSDAYHEIGLRMLIGFLCREATKYEKVVEPIASWAMEHYYRVHVGLRRSTSLSAKVYEKVGHVFYCDRCNAKFAVPMGDSREFCRCGNRLVAMGPLWLGELKSVEVVKKASEVAEGRARKFLDSLAEECDAPTVYNLQRIAQRLKVNTPKTDEVVERLREMGYEASKTHYCGFCVRTDAEIEEVEKVISSLRRV